MWGGCNLPISVGAAPISEVHFTQALLKLASFTPLEAESTQDPWASIVTPYKIAEWERFGLSYGPRVCKICVHWNPRRVPHWV